MGSRDRDRERDARKEQALERILPGALAGENAGGESCPDAELLAAFYERSLAPAEVTHWRAHFSTCRRCQLSLAALAASDPRPLSEKEVARLGELVADATTPPAVADSPVRAKPRKIKWPWYLDPRALAPMAAAAAFVAAVGLTIHSQRVAMQLESQNATSQQVIVAENRGEPAPPALQMPAPSEESRAAAPAEPKKVSNSTEPAPLGSMPEYSVGITASREETRAQSAAPAEQPAPAAFAPAAPPPPPPPSPAEATDRAASENGAAPGGNSEARGGTAAPPPESTPAEAPSASANAPASGAPAPAATASAPLEAHAASSHVRREKGVVYLGNSPAQTESSEGDFIGGNAPGKFSATSPDGHTAWRFGRGGLIERSTNASAATADQIWTREKSPLQMDLLAGSALSPTVCWIVGRAGAILRTTDGVTWQVIPTPPSAARDGALPDFVSVTATGVDTATITTADGRTYHLTDGGRTWQMQ